MVELPKNIKELFYDPRSDSISSLLGYIKGSHDKILEMTNFSSCIVSSKKDNNLDFLNFKIDYHGISEENFCTTISDLFAGVCRWHSPNVMYNVVPLPVIPSVAAKTLTSLYNPNLCLDTASGKSLLVEQGVVRAIAEYIGWDGELAGGTFTWGGKATIMYGIKLGLKNCCPNSSRIGVKDDVIVFSTSSGHPAHTSDADWLGIGTANVFRIKVNKNGEVDLFEMEKSIREKVLEGKKIAAIVISGGNTNSMIVDPIEGVVDLRDRLTKELNLDYIPHIHVDSVVSFPWIFFKDYDFTKNPLNIEKPALNRILGITNNLKGLYRADSFGIDFHKMGFCPYMTCVFMAKNKKSLSGDHNVSRWPFFYTIENSRPGDGPNSAFIALKVLGVSGFQLLVAHLTEVAVNLQEKISSSGKFEIIGEDSLGTSVMFIPLIPKKIKIPEEQDQVIIRNNYTSRFIKRLADLNYPYYIDQMPGNCSGSCRYPLISLKAYITSPHSSIKSNIEFVDFLVNLKKDIDASFDFTDNKISQESILPHPLK